MLNTTSSKFYNLNSLMVKTPKGDVDISKVFSTFIIYESIYQSFINAVMVINMPRGFIEDNNIQKGAEVYFSAQNKNENLELDFIVARIEQAEQVQNIQIKDNSFIIYLVTKEASKVLNLFFQGKYSGKPEDIIKNNLMSSGFDPKKFYTKIENTTSIINFNGMNFNVEDFLLICSKYAINSKNSGYLFFQNLSGYNFVTIDYLINQNQNKINKVSYGHYGYNPGMLFDDSKFVNAGFSYHESFVPENNFGEIDYIYNGEYKSVNLNTNYQNKIYLSEIGNNIYGEDISADKFNTNLESVAKNIIRIKSAKDINEFNIMDMLGDFNRVAGNIMSITMPNKDKPVIGLISKVKHIFKSSISYNANYKMLII